MHTTNVTLEGPPAEAREGMGPLFCSEKIKKKIERKKKHTLGKLYHALKFECISNNFSNINLQNFPGMQAPGTP